METNVSEALLRHSADVASQLVDRLGERKPLLPGYRLKVVDGNHITGTDHRLEVLRDEGGAALPGVAVADRRSQWDLLRHDDCAAGRRMGRISNALDRCFVTTVDPLGKEYEAISLPKTPAR
ncbi:hypothetical protein [Thalassoglobus polymorphus]|nr:hypothetical protein [Thalassoglobus polymorphus]